MKRENFIKKIHENDHNLSVSFHSKIILVQNMTMLYYRGELYWDCVEILFLIYIYKKLFLNCKFRFVCLFVCLFVLILNVPSTIFQLNRDGSS